MKKSKKEKLRPRFVCERCGAMWVSHKDICIICDIVGAPLNADAEKVIEKRKGDNRE